MAEPERQPTKPPNPPTASAPPPPSKAIEVPSAPKPAPAVAAVPAAATVPVAPPSPAVAAGSPTSKVPAARPTSTAPPAPKVKGDGGAKPGQPTCDSRRGFFAKTAAIVIGAIITIFPFAAGLFFFLDPFRRGGAGFGFIKIAALDAVPDDGMPRAFTVVADCTDAWTCFPSEPIGAVFLQREKGRAKPVAFQTTCPHAGCMIDFLAGERKFRCPCHNSSFQIDGQIIEPSPSPRSMDTLDCEVRDNHGVKEVWVKYESFVTGTAQKITKG